MKNTANKYHLGLVVLILIASFLRLYNLGNVPIALNRDEVSLGYTAFSIAREGTDERGIFFPLNVKSFGDWKLGGYIYVLAPFVSLLGLSSWVVRLPSALAGIASVGLIYILAKQLLVSSEKGIREKLPLIAAFLLTASPWHIHVSRIAYEGNIGMFFTLLGLALFFRGIQKQKYWLILSSLSASFALLTYHSYQLIIPLIGLMLFYMYQKELGEIWSKHRQFLVYICIVPLLVVGALLLSNSKFANQTKLRGLSIFSKPHYSQQLFEERQRFPQLLQPIAMIYSNTPILIFRQLAANIFSIISPSFLFTNGGSHSIHHVSGLGLLHWFEALTLVIGLYIASNERKKWQLVVLGWLGVAALPALITFEASHPIRFLFGIIPLTLLSSFGLWHIWNRLSKVSAPTAITFLSKSALLLIVAGSCFMVLSTYFFQFPHTSANSWPWYMNQVEKKVWLAKDQYKKIIIQGESASPYIYFLFENQLLPSELATDLEYYPETEEGFQHAKRLYNIYFETADWGAIEDKEDRVLIVLEPKQIPGDKLEQAQYKIIDTITNKDSAIEFVFLEYDRTH